MSSDSYPVVRFDAGGVVWHLSEDVQERVRDWILKNFINTLENESALLKKGRGKRVGAADGLVVKESTARGSRLMLRFGLRRSGARRAFLIGNRLLACGISTPRPLAWATVRYYGLRVRDYLITEEVINSRPLTRVLEEVKDSGGRTRTIDLLGELTARFHTQGFSNRDLKDSNILVTGETGDRLWVVDLDGVMAWHMISRRRSSKDMWAVVRSLMVHGWSSAPELQRLQDAYNRHVPDRLKLGGLPQDGAGVLVKENIE